MKYVRLVNLLFTLTLKMSSESCPICNHWFISSTEIVDHVNKCLFLNTTEHNANNFASSCEPLSRRLRPKLLQDFIGHRSLTSQNTCLKHAVDNDQIPNVVFWGPPGCGKSSLTGIFVETCRRNPKNYVYLETSAVTFNIIEVYSMKNCLKKHQRLVLFVDQVHWLNKKQQNQLLSLITNYDLSLVGATTENPSFSLTESFLNICRVVVMQKLRIFEVVEILENAARVLNIDVIDDHNTLRNMFRDKQKKSIKRTIIRSLAESCDGDARIALNNFELVVQQNSYEIKPNVSELKKSYIMYDRDSEEHHNIISAMHESIKGYNDNATLYWTTRMLLGGEDVQFIARRLLRAASEDTGNKDVTALQLAISTMEACKVLERSESEVILAQCAVYLARAPTSKEAHTALTLAKQLIVKSKRDQPKVPLLLRNIPDIIISERGGSSKSFMPPELEKVKFV